jgi:hypothetical protein
MRTPLVGVMTTEDHPDYVQRRQMRKMAGDRMVSNQDIYGGGLRLRKRIKTCRGMINNVINGNMMINAGR